MPRAHLTATAIADKAQGGRGHALVHAYDCIKESIINMAVSPGQKLHAQELAARLNVSRTPIREALGRLEQEGLVRRDSGWGYVVRPMNLKEISTCSRCARLWSRSRRPKPRLGLPKRKSER